VDYVQPKELIEDALAAVSRKADLPIRDLLIRGCLAGAILSYATSLVFVVVSQGQAALFCFQRALSFSCFSVWSWPREILHCSRLGWRTAGSHF
jgi:formate/nitrite transporter FocA (FNT family)